MRLPHPRLRLPPRRLPHDVPLPLRAEQPGDGDDATRRRPAGADDVQRPGDGRPRRQHHAFVLPGADPTHRPDTDTPAPATRPPASPSEPRAVPLPPSQIGRVCSSFRHVLSLIGISDGNYEGWAASETPLLPLIFASSAEQKTTHTQTEPATRSGYAQTEPPAPAPGEAPACGLRPDVALESPACGLGSSSPSAPPRAAAAARRRRRPSSMPRRPPTRRCRRRR